MRKAIKEILIRSLLVMVIITLLVLLLQALIAKSQFTGTPLIYVAGLLGGLVIVLKMDYNQLILSILFLFGVAFVIPGPAAAGIYYLIKFFVPSTPDYVMPLMIIPLLVLGIVMIVKAYKLNKRLALSPMASQAAMDEPVSKFKKKSGLGK